MGLHCCEFWRIAFRLEHQGIAAGAAKRDGENGLDLGFFGSNTGMWVSSSKL
jgi:hypothetical protein